MEQKLVTESSEHRKESFAAVYDNNRWEKLKSGPGSKLVNARKVINVLNILIEKIKKHLGMDKIRRLL